MDCNTVIQFKLVLNQRELKLIRRALVKEGGNGQKLLEDINKRLNEAREQVLASIEGQFQTK